MGYERAPSLTWRFSCLRGEKVNRRISARPHTPSLTQKQAIALLAAVPTDTLRGIRDLAPTSLFFLTGCRVSAVTGACAGHMETDGVENFLNVTEKRNKKRRKILEEHAEVDARRIQIPRTRFTVP